MATTDITSLSSFSQPAISFTGLSSNIDFAGIIDKLEEAESFQIRRLTTWKTEWTDKITALQTLNAKLTGLKTAAAGMDTPGEFQAKTAASSNSTVVTATAAGSAGAGAHQVLVNQLAQNEVEVHQGLSAADTVINSSGAARVFAFTYGTTTVSLSVASGTTLTGLAEAINLSGANPGVTAAVLDLGAGAGATRYRLLLQGNDSGSANTIAIDDALTTLDGTGGTENFESAAFTESQSAQNAQLRVDGVPPSGWIERASNTVADVLPGVTLTLLATSAAPVTVTVTDDPGAAQEKIAGLVESYNEVMAYIKEQTRYDTATGEAGILLGNYAVGLVKSELAAIGTGNAPGFEDPGDPFLNLAQIGVTTDSDETSATFGQLVIDEAVLGEALASDPQGVGRLLAAYFRGVSDDASGNITYAGSLPGLTQPGTYQIEATVTGGVLSGTINGHPATASGDTLTGQSGYPESGLAVRVATSDGSYSGVVRLQLGVAPQLESRLEDLLSASAGPLNILVDNYQEIVDGIDAKIEFEERRVAGVVQRLTEQFARLEALLGQLQDQSNYLAAQFKKMGLSS